MKKNIIFMYLTFIFIMCSSFVNKISKVEITNEAVFYAANSEEADTYWLKSGYIYILPKSAIDSTGDSSIYVHLENLEIEFVGDRSDIKDFWENLVKDDEVYPILMLKDSLMSEVEITTSICPYLDLSNLGTYSVEDFDNDGIFDLENILNSFIEKLNDPFYSFIIVASGTLIISGMLFILYKIIRRR